MNQCPRCYGSMYQTTAWDLEVSGTGFLQWSCLNCGEVVDDTILRNRALEEMPLTRREVKQESQRLGIEKVNPYVKKHSNQSIPPLMMEHK